MVGMEQLKTSVERGVAGVVAVTLAMPDPKSTIFAVAISLLLYCLIERPSLLGKNSPEDDKSYEPAKAKEDDKA